MAPQVGISSTSKKVDLDPNDFVLCNQRSQFNPKRFFQCMVAMEISPSPLLLTKAKFYDSGALPYTRSRDWSPRCVMSRVTYGHPTSLLLHRHNRPFWGRLRPRGLIGVYPLTSPSVLVRQLTFFLREDKREFVRDGAIDEGTEGKVVAPPLFSSHDV